MDNRFENVYGFMNTTRNLAHSILVNLQKEYENHGLIEEMILNQTEQSARVRPQLSKLSYAISSLIQGRIPPFLIRPKHMKQIVQR